MLNITQIVGIIVAVSLTGLLLVIGYQIVLILIELKTSLTKINKVLDDTSRISESIANPLVSFSGFLTGIKDGAKLIKLFTDKDKKG